MRARVIVLLTGVLPALAACGPSGEQIGTGAAVVVSTSSGDEMVVVPGGTFTMGSSEGEGDESPAHEVSLQPFAIDRYEVTQEQYLRWNPPNPSHFKDPRRPVEQVSWADAAEFCNARSRAEGLEPCYDENTFACNFAASGYRLPTEAEWEYACRAGGETSPTLTSSAWYSDNSDKTTHLVGRKRPNAWGLHDMLGNVLEWCHDRYAADYYAQSPGSDPKGAPLGKKRVLRGGSWASTAKDCGPTRRLSDIPGTDDACFAKDTYGFRCVRKLSEEERAKLEKVKQEA